MNKTSLDLVISGRLPPSLSEIGVKKIILRTLEALKLNTAVLGLAFLTESKMEEKNMVYRKKIGPTDVLSFAYPKPKGTRVLVGDILICASYAAKQAKEESVPVDQELERLLIHGLLHLAGFDHVKPGEAKRMFGLQERLLKL